MNALIVSVVLAIATSPILFGQENAEARKAGAAASDFFNAYIKAIPDFNGYEGAIAWVKKNPLASPAFKAAVEKIYRDALSKDPEFGYGADAILGAQDYPDGFRIKQSSAESNKAEVELIGIEPFPMQLRVLLIKQNDKWLVDGSGDLLE